MAEAKKSASKRIIDVQHADKTPATDTSKPVIVTNRPILQDPMVVDNTAPEEPITKTTGGTTIQPLSAPEVPGAKSKTKQEEPAAPQEDQAESQLPSEPQPAGEASGPELETTKTLADLDAESKTKDSAKASPQPAENAQQESPQTEQEDTPDEPDNSPGLGQKTADQVTQDEELAAAEEARKDEELVKLAESKKYFLPINSVEKRRSKQVVVAGVILSLVLILAWLDIALDAGLVSLGGIKAVTNFF